MMQSAERLNGFRQALQEACIDAMLVRNTSNIRWLTAFDDVFDEEQAHALFVDQAHAVLHTDSRYATACEQAAQGTEIQINTTRVSHAQFAADQGAQSLYAANQMAIEDAISLREYRALQKAFSEQALQDQAISDEDNMSEFKETQDFVISLRAIKDGEEIKRMKAAQAITDAAFTHIVSFMQVGMTEKEVQLELDNFMMRRGAQGLAFPSIVAAGPHGASPHAIPGDTVLEAGQCVVMDFGARAQGYCSDMTRTVFLGEPDTKMRQAWDAMRAANETVEAMLKPGVTGKEAHMLAEQILAEGGFEGKMGHGLGHGVGIDIHEEPVLSPRNEKPLVIGNVVTVEPGIYLPGEFGMRLEDFGVITETGFEVFTQSTHDLVVL